MLNLVCLCLVYYNWFFVFDCICAVLRGSLLCNSFGLSAVKINEELLSRPPGPALAGRGGLYIYYYYYSTPTICQGKNCILSDNKTFIGDFRSGQMAVAKMGNMTGFAENNFPSVWSYCSAEVHLCYTKCVNTWLDMLSLASCCTTPVDSTLQMHGM